MLTANKQKLIVSLQQKKNRQEQNMFVVEGIKIVSEYILTTTFIVEVFINDADNLSQAVLNEASLKNIPITISDENVMRKISSHQTPQHCIALVKIPKSYLNFESLKSEICIALDNLQDPGNLGTIIRTADWFGIKNIVCSDNTVDCYNPKVVQATMGSLCNVNIHYVDLNSFLQNCKTQHFKIYGTIMNGSDLKKVKIEKGSVLLFGNEANGVTENNIKLMDEGITIKKHLNTFAESLNVATSVAIILSSI